MSHTSHPQVATRLLETTQKPTSFPIIIRLHLRRQYNGWGLHITLQAIRSLSCSFSDKLYIYNCFLNVLTFYEDDKLLQSGTKLVIQLLISNCLICSLTQVVPSRFSNIFGVNCGLFLSINQILSFGQ